MDKKEEGSEKESCCSSSGSCGGHRCCTGKAALALVLLLIGGLIGFGIGHCHSARYGGCPYSMGSHMEAPLPPSK